MQTCQIVAHEPSCGVHILDIVLKIRVLEFFIESFIVILKQEFSIEMKRSKKSHVIQALSIAIARGQFKVVKGLLKIDIRISLYLYIYINYKLILI